MESMKSSVKALTKEKREYEKRNHVSQDEVKAREKLIGQLRGEWLRVWMSTSVVGGDELLNVCLYVCVIRRDG